MKKAKNPKQSTPERRRYDSPLRREQSAATRERIVVAGAELAHEFTTWDWKNLTFRAVSERAGVSERTVYRYFSTERLLRDAVVQKLVEDADINMEELNLGDYPDVTARVFSTLSTFAVTPEPMLDPTFSSLDRIRRNALMNAVSKEAPTWKEEEQEMAAAVLDLMWNPFAYDRLIAAWGLNLDKANRANTWLIGLIQDAIAKGHKP